MQNQLKYHAIAAAIAHFSKITLFTHLDPDGDTIGSAVGLKALILANFADKDVQIAGAAFPRNLTFLGATDDVSTPFIRASIAIVIDTSTSKRVFDQRYLLTKNRLKIDHHDDEGGNWIVNLAGDHYAATGEIMTDLAIANQWEVNSKAATALYTAIYSDTELFTHRQITKQTWKRVAFLEAHGAKRNEIAAYYAPPASAKPFLNYLKQHQIVVGTTTYIIIKKAQVAHYQLDLSLFKAYVRALRSATSLKWALIVELPTFIRIGIRAQGAIDVSPLAQAFGGGGHQHSAGTKVQTWAEVTQFITALQQL